MFPGTPFNIQNDQQKERFRKIIHIAQPTKRLNELAKLLAGISKCPAPENEDDPQNKGCGNIIPNRVTLRNHQIICEEKTEDPGRKKEIIYTASRVRNIFAKITTEDYKLLGFHTTRPVDLLISTVAVAPPQIRPSI